MAVSVAVSEPSNTASHSTWSYSQLAAVCKNTASWSTVCKNTASKIKVYQHALTGGASRSELLREMAEGCLERLSRVSREMLELLREPIPSASGFLCGLLKSIAEKRPTRREDQRISMRNLGLEFLRFHHSNKYKYR